MHYSDEGEIYVFSVSTRVPRRRGTYGAIIDMKDGISVRGTSTGGPLAEPRLVRQEVKMYGEKVATDKDGNDVIAAKFKVVD